MQADVARLIDANANRAREGIRTAEDYIRFISGESRWAAALKNIRASITANLHSITDGAELVRNRLVETDPLRPVEGRAEHPQTAEPPRQVAVRGTKRAQEALRVLEEFLRGENAEAASALSRARYQLYEAEQWLVCASESSGILYEANVYALLTESLCKRGLLQTAEAVMRGGVKVLQLREKSMPDWQVLKKAHDLRKCCSDHGSVLICNDRVDVSLAAHSAGVHLGQDDLTPVQARGVSGERLLIGRSTHSVEQARTAVEVEGADYIGIGSMYDTKTKPERTLAGVKLAEEVSALKLKVPVFAIGGISLERLEELKRAGVRRVAVSSAIIAADDPEAQARRFVEAMTV